MTEISSVELNQIDEKERISYILNTVFDSKYILGKIKKILDGGDAFVTICLGNNTNKIYKIDGKPWDVYFNLKDVDDSIKKTLKSGDYIYFEPNINKRKPEQVIQINTTTIKKVVEYREFLKEAEIPIQSVVLDGNVALEREDDVKVWITKELYTNFERLYKDLIDNITLSKNELQDVEAKKEEVELEIKVREEDIQCKHEEMDKLANKLSYFGFKSFKDGNTDKIINKDELIILKDPRDVFEYIKSYIKINEKLSYSDEILRRFLIALQSKELIILSGPSGTGKTSLVTAFSKAIGGESKIIAVKPSWTDTEDLIGFFNPIERTYISTPFLDALVEAKKNPDKMYLICLDEMNLAHVEYYFSEFLSKLEVNADNPSIELYSKEIQNEILEEIECTINLMNGDNVIPTIENLKKWCEENKKDYNVEMLRLKKKITSVEKYPAVFEIPNNIRFIGTMNVDQTTKHISPKVVDRSFVIELLKYKAEDVIENELEKVEQKFVPSSKFNTVNNLNNFENEILEGLDTLNNTYLEYLNSSFNNRTIKHIKKYLSNLETYNFDLDKKNIMNDLIAMKVLPRINISFKNKNDEKYIKWHQFTKMDVFDVGSTLTSKIEKMNKFSEEDNILSFWGVY